MQKPRGVLPSRVDDAHVALFKAGPRLRNSYEVRLCLYLAVSRGKEFTLVVAPDAIIDAGLEAHLATHGGCLIRHPVEDHSVYVGAEDSAGEELDGWVAGHDDRWKEVLSGVTSEWLRKNLVVGREFHGQDLERLRAECLSCALPGTNVDDEPLAAAMLHLIEAARARTGRVFIQ